MLIRTMIQDLRQWVELSKAIIGTRRMAGPRAESICLDDESDDTQFPHCDARVLHAPGECEYCDRHPDWQRERQLQQINFTGHTDPECEPCPSEKVRTLELIERWPGNRAKRSS